MIYNKHSLINNYNKQLKNSMIHIENLRKWLSLNKILQIIIIIMKCIIIIVGMLKIIVNKIIISNKGIVYVEFKVNSIINMKISRLYLKIMFIIMINKINNFLRNLC